MPPNQRPLLPNNHNWKPKHKKKISKSIIFADNVSFLRLVCTKRNKLTLNFWEIHERTYGYCWANYNQVETLEESLYLFIY